MSRKTDYFVLALLFLLFLAGGCNLSNNPKDSDSLDNEFTLFEILTSDNPGLTNSITGRLTDTEILLESSDFTAPDYLIPRYETEAVSVEVEGEEQENGVTSQDFTNTVKYTLTDSAGNTRQYNARLVLGSGWYTLGTPSPLKGPSVFNLKALMVNELTPYIISFDESSDVVAFHFDSSSDTWIEHNIVEPAGVDSLDAVNWGGAAFVLYEVSGTVSSEMTVDPNTWGGASLVAAGIDSHDLQLAKATEDRVFAAWIEDPSGAKDIALHKYDGSWTAMTPPDTEHDDAYSEIELVAAGGDHLYLACLMEEAPGVIHLFEYDGTDWEGPFFDDESPFCDEGIVFIDMFYDSEEQTPVLFAAFPNSAEGYDLRALYWDLDETSGTWSDYHPSGDGIPPLTLSSSELAGLSLHWDEDFVMAVAGNKVMSCKDGSWTQLGDDFDTFTPGDSAIMALDENTALISYIDDATVDDLIVKVKQ